MAVTSVDSTTTSTRLAVSHGRQGVAVRNTDANALYLLLDSGTASATNHTVALVQDAYFETPFDYEGEVNGVWAANGSGVALVTEF